MTDRHDILPDGIGRLLELYYEGETSPEQEDTLMDYFAACEDVPEEYAADAAMFRALAESRAGALPTPPDDLEARIVARTCGRSSKMRLRDKLLIWGSAAVAAAVAAVLVLPLLSMPELDTEAPVIAEVFEPEAARVEPVSAQRVDEAVAAPPAITEKKQPPMKRVAAEAEPQSVADESYAEVADSAEAARIAGDVMRLLHRTLAASSAQVSRSSDLAMESVDKAIDRTISSL